jgi:hypothetical protein
MILPGMRQKAYEAITANTQEPEKAVAEKHETVLEIEERRLMAAGPISQFRTAYLGGGADIALPLALGCRRIDIVDCGFASNPTDIIEAFAAVERIIGHPVAVGIVTTTLAFQFDFGFGLEQAEVRFVPARINTSRCSCRGCVIPAYVPDEPLGLILGFRTIMMRLGDDHPELLDRVVQGGYVLLDQCTSMLPFPEPFRQVVESVNTAVGTDVAREPFHTLTERLYADGPYEPIRLNGSRLMTFLRKRHPQ